MMEVGMYVRTKCGLIAKIQGINEYLIALKNTCCERLRDKCFTFPNEEKIYEIKKVSNNIIDLIEYMDLLNIENPIKLYDKEIEVSLFNPVRCDGFTTYEDGTTCIILNLDYFVDVKTLKIKSVLTHEQCKVNEYVVKE